MCGIAGYLQKDSEQPAPALPLMLAQLRRRGPDDCGEHRWPHVGLAAARLSMVGGASGRQPQLGEGSRSGLVLNGEIYNWRDLGSSSAGSDTAVARELLDRRGRDALARFTGGFALAFWNEANQSLFLARDEYGQKPLYYWENDGRILFASTIRALMAVGLGPELGAEGLKDLAQLQFFAPGRTLFAGVSQVMPGECLTLKLGAKGIQRHSSRFKYRDPLSHRDARPDEIRELLSASLNRQGPSDHPSALFLSGGLDSSALAAGFAASSREVSGESPAPKGLNFAMVGAFEGNGVPDERPFARIAARNAGLELAEFVISPWAWAESMPQVIEALEMPYAGPGSVAQYLLCERAAARGARIVYGGQGGDELFGGYERLRILQSLLSESRTAADSSYAALLASMTVAFEKGGFAAAYAAALARGRGLADLPRKSPGQLGVLAAAAASGLDFGRFGSRAPGTVAEVEAFEFEVLLPGLLAVDDRCSSHFSMESRLPFLDQPFAAAVRRIKMQDKSPASNSRLLFREAFSEWLPKAIRDRRDKCGFAVPLAAWFEGPLKSWATGILRDPSVTRRGWWTDEEAGALIADPKRHGRMIFHCLSLEFWQRAFGSNADSTRLSNVASTRLSNAATALRDKQTRLPPDGQKQVSDSERTESQD
ncbi:MAG: asparagine synthase (glutamine-hydrolyzing) [Planctomycetota bacterium]